MDYLSDDDRKCALFWRCRLDFGARVGGIVGLGQMLKIEPGVDLRRGDADVAQQFLHRAQVAAGLEQVAGERVTQHVRMHRRAQTRLLAALTQALPDRLGAQAGAVATYKQRGLNAASRSRWPRLGQLQRL